MLLYALVWKRLPGTTGTAASPQRRWSRYGFPAAYPTTDPDWDGPENETPNKLNTIYQIKLKFSIISRQFSVV